MNSIVKSKVLLFLIALAIPTIVFIIMAYMMPILLKGDITLSPYICIIIVTQFLIISAYQINDDFGTSLAKSVGILLGVILGASFLYFWCFKEELVNINEKEILMIMFIFGWTLSISEWTSNLFKKQQEVSNSNEISVNDDLLGAWYGVDSKLSCWLPVLVFEKNYIATFSDGKVVKEYNYHICCNTCIILTAKDGEKFYVKRVWIKGKPQLFYNEQVFTQDGTLSK